MVSRLYFLCIGEFVVVVSRPNCCVNGCFSFFIWSGSSRKFVESYGCLGLYI